MLLNEEIDNNSEILELKQENLPKGILARVRRLVCTIGEKNANKRRYSKELWERVINDPEIKTKLENRQMLGEMEHPTGGQIKLDPDRTSHIISNIFMTNEGKVYADFDLLPSKAGQFIYILHEAGVKVPASLRAEGDLESITEQDGISYNVIPESYCLKTIDHTGDPSFQGTEPIAYVKAINKGVTEHKVDRDTAINLLESITSTEATTLLESISKAKEHNCKNGLCIGCGCHGKKEVKESLKVGDIAILNNKNVIINQIFEKTGKCIIQEGITRKIVEMKDIKPLVIKETVNGKESRKDDPYSDDADIDNFFEHLAKHNEFTAKEATQIAKRLGWDGSDTEVQEEVIKLLNSEIKNKNMTVKSGIYVWESKVNEANSSEYEVSISQLGTITTTAFTEKDAISNAVARFIAKKPGLKFNEFTLTKASMPSIIQQLVDMHEKGSSFVTVKKISKNESLDERKDDNGDEYPIGSIITGQITPNGEKYRGKVTGYSKSSDDVYIMTDDNKKVRLVGISISKLDESVEYGRPVAARIEKKGKAYLKLVMKAINGGDEDFEGAKAAAIKLGAKPGTFEADVEDLDAELVGLGESIKEGRGEEIYQEALEKAKSIILDQLKKDHRWDDKYVRDYIMKTYHLTRHEASDIMWDAASEDHLDLAEKPAFESLYNKYLGKDMKKVNETKLGLEIFLTALQNKQSNIKLAIDRIKEWVKTQEGLEVTASSSNSITLNKMLITKDTINPLISDLGVQVGKLNESNEDVSADNKELSDIDIIEIAKKLGYEGDPQAVLKGFKVEQEHKETVNGDNETMIKIALDHLKENSKYYDFLAKMEEEMKNPKKEINTEEVKESVNKVIKNRISEATLRESKNEQLETLTEAFDKLEANYITDILSLTEKVNTYESQLDIINKLKADIAESKKVNKNSKEELERVKAEMAEALELVKKLEKEHEELKVSKDESDKKAELATANANEAIKEARVNVLTKLTGLQLDAGTLALLKEAKDDDDLLNKVEEVRDILARKCLHSGLIEAKKNESKPPVVESPYMSYLDKILS